MKIKAAFLDIADENLSENQKAEGGTWYDEACQKIVEERNRPRQVALQIVYWSKAERHRTLRRRVKATCRKNKSI